MNVQPTAIQPPASADTKRAELQMLLLKKALQAQQDQAAEITKQIEGKGQTIDFRA